MEERMTKQLEKKEEQILATVSSQIQILGEKNKIFREEDKVYMAEQVQVVKGLIKQESKQRNEEQEQNKSWLQSTEEKITKQEEILEKHSHRINVVEDKMDELKHTASKLQQTTIPGHITVTCMGSSFNHDNVKFNGKLSNPHEYLTRLRRSYEKNRIRYGMDNNNLECLYEVIESSVERSTAQWWQLNKEKVESWDQFEELFLEKYWNTEIQRHLKHKIELDRYRPGGRLNRVDYFLVRVLTLKSMTPPLNEADIVNMMATHYDDIVQTAQRVQNVNTIKAFESLLQREDMMDTQRNLQGYNQLRSDRMKPHQNNQQQTNNPFNGKENYRAYIPRHQQNYRKDYQDQENRKIMFKNQDTNPANQYYKKFDQTNNPRQNKTPDNHYRYPNQQNRTNKQEFYPTREQIDACNMIMKEGKENIPNPKETRTFVNSQHQKHDQSNTDISTLN